MSNSTKRTNELTPARVGFGPLAFRTLPYLAWVRPEEVSAAKEQRECKVVFCAFAYLVDFPSTTWSERVRQIDFAIDVAFAHEGSK